VSLAHLLVATGFNREARIVAQPGVVVIAGGGVQADLEAKLEAQAQEAIGIVSFGLAGALRDGLDIGDWVIASRLTGALQLETESDWRDAALARLPGSKAGVAFADGRMIDSIAEKRGLGSQADIVDMESHIAARVARRHGLPFAVIRCVSDRVDHMLPHAITVSMRPGGAIDGMAMMGSLLRRPGQLPDLLATMWHAGKAFRALLGGNSVLGPGLGFPDFAERLRDMA
jgi:adenosylhomocysteine nucleosidase